MPQAVDSITSVLEELGQRIRELEQRVASLEAARNVGSSDAEAPTEAALQNGGALIAMEESRQPVQTARIPPARRPATWGGFPPIEMPSGAVAVLGKAVLGIAGAYLLRAIAELPSVPRLPVLILAILYASFWMAWAARAHSRSAFSSATYAITSALIMSPLLWEATIRFQALSPAVTAFVLCAYAALAIGLAWRGKLQLIPWIATLASVTIALALIIATHELVIFATTLLGIAASVEVAACLGYWLTLRAVPALAADFSIWLVISILGSPAAVPEGYRAAGASTVTLLCLLLPAIYAASIAIRIFAQRNRLTILEIGQSLLAFALGTYGAIHATEGRIGLALGVFFLLMGAGCYWGALSRFSDVAHTRNRRVSATWAVALCLAGVFLLVPANLQTVVLCVGAIVAALAYMRRAKVSLGMHASFYLLAASAISPLPNYVSGALAGNIPGAPDWPIAVIAFAAAICYGIGSCVREENPTRRLLWITPAAVVAFTVAAASIVAVVSLARIELAASTLSVIRTIANCAVAVGLGFLGSHSERLELRWLAYAAVGLGAIKLLLEDLRFGNAASLVVSLLFYGMVLILLPRFARRPEGTS